MKKLIFIMLTVLYIPLAIAHQTAMKNPQFVNVTLQITHDSNDTQWSIDNSLSLQNNKHWTSIHGLQTSPTTSSTPQNHLILPAHQSLSLVRIVKADSKKVTLEFLIINKELDYYSVNQPSLIINYNQKGAIDILDKNNTHIKISAIANIKA